MITSVLLYGYDGCSFCEKAKELLFSRNYVVDYRDIKAPGIKDELLSIFPEAKTVPQIFMNGVHIGGYTNLVEYLK